MCSAPSAPENADNVTVIAATDQCSAASCPPPVMQTIPRPRAQAARTRGPERRGPVDRVAAARRRLLHEGCRTSPARPVRAGTIPTSDVLIVGAGPGGSNAARAALDGGLSVVQIEAQRFPRVKPCAGGITRKAKRALALDIRPSLRGTSNAIEFNFWRKRTNRFTAWGDRDGAPEDALVSFVSRAEFDADLVRQNGQSARFEFSDGERVEHIEFDGVFRVRTSKRVLTARQLIGADGAYSIVNRTFGVAKPRTLATASEVNVARSRLTATERLVPGWTTASWKTATAGSSRKTTTSPSGCTRSRRNRRSSASDWSTTSPRPGLGPTATRSKGSRRIESRSAASGCGPRRPRVRGRRRGRTRGRARRQGHLSRSGERPARRRNGGARRGGEGLAPVLLLPPLALGLARHRAHARAVDAVSSKRGSVIAAPRAPLRLAAAHLRLCPRRDIHGLRPLGSAVPRPLVGARTRCHKACWKETLADGNSGLGA